MKYSKSNRRMFLQGAGGFLLAIPFLESLIPKSARAQVIAPLQRYLFIQNPNQTKPEWISPNRSVFGAADIIQAGLPYRAKLLQEIFNQTGGISQLVGPEHQALFAKMNIIRSLDLYGRLDHGSGHIHGNVACSKNGLIIDFNNNALISQAWNPTATIDNVLVDSGALYGAGNTPLTTLNLGQSGVSCQFDPNEAIWQAGQNWSYGVVPNSTNSQGYVGGSGSIYFNSNPRTIVDNLFTNSSSGGGGNSSGGSSEFSRMKAIDNVLAEFTSIIAGTKIGAVDRNILTQHFDILSQVSNNIGSSGGGSTGPSCPTMNSSLFADNAGVNNIVNTSVADVNRFWQEISSIAASAFLCNLTRVINIRYDASAAAGGYRSHRGDPRLWHLEDAHMNGNTNLIAHGKSVIDNVLAPIASQLDSVVEQDGKTFLDNSLLWYCPEASYGHASAGYAIVTLGGIGGKMVTGKYFDYGDSSNATTGTNGVSGDLHIGLPMNKWWGTILQAYGLSTADYDSTYGNQNRPAGSKGFGLYWQNTSGYESYFTDATSQATRTAQFNEIELPLPGLLTTPPT